MQELCAHIEALLNTHNFVVIPAFGGFVAAQQGARLMQGTLYPPTKVIGFNPDLTFNDGLLAQAIAKAHHTTLEQANSWVEGKTFELIQYLHQYKSIPFGHIGSFLLVEGKIQFEPAAQPLELNSNFGLSTVYFPEVRVQKRPVFTVVQPSAAATGRTATAEQNANQTAKATARTKAATQTEPTEAPIVKPLQPTGRKFNYAAVAAVIAFLMLLIPMHFGQQQSNYRASFVAPPVLEEVVEETPVDNADVKPACTPYHVVIGSFYTQVKALQFLDELPKELKQSQIVYSDHRFRIIAASFETEEAGLNGVEQIAQAFPAYEDAWLLLYNP